MELAPPADPPWKIERSSLFLFVFRFFGGLFLPRLSPDYFLPDSLHREDDKKIFFAEEIKNPCCSRGF
jgi:hypothetical protein